MHPQPHINPQLRFKFKQIVYLCRLFINIYELAMLERIKECDDTQGILLMFAVSNFLLTINSSVNVLVYAYKSKDYRKALMNLFCIRR